jgi:hypothetical protein
MQTSRNFLLAAAMAAIGMCAVHATPAEARVSVAIYANVPPPPLRSEVVPAPRAGYIWVPGDWRWGHRRYNWHRGSWVRERRGHHYSPGRWDRDGDHDRWRYHSGRWER